MRSYYSFNPTSRKITAQKNLTGIDFELIKSKQPRVNSEPVLE